MEKGIQELLSKINKKDAVLRKEFTFIRSSIDEEKRTCEIAFSSEDPYERWWGIEILDHGKTSIRLGRLKNGAPLLWMHDSKAHIGIVEKVIIGEDRVGRAVVRFGKGQLANEKFQDVIDGILTKVSVGYIIHDMVLESKTGDVSTFRVSDWEPLEISMVSIPADDTVGVGRSAETQIYEQSKKTVNNMDKKDENQNTPAATPATPAAPAVDVKAVANEVREKELARINALEAVGETYAGYGAKDMAREFIKTGKTADELKLAILEKVGDKKAVPTAEIGLNDKEVRSYSFLRVMNALANPRDHKAQEAAAFEIEASRAAAEKLGKTPQGIIVPVDVLRAGFQRDLTVGTSTAGGHTVGTNLLAGSFIEVLRKKMVTQRLGARVLNGLVGNIAIPRQTGGATAYWVAESGAPTESQQAFDQVTMSPKTLGAFVDISRKLMLQSSIDVEAFVRDDIAKIIALEADRAALYGSGSSNQPLGLKNVSGINTKDFAAMAPTFAEIVALETEVAADNADIGALKYLMNARGRGTLKTTEKATNTAQFIWGNDNLVNGYAAEVSNQVEGNGSSTEDYFFGNWDDMVIGFWSGIDLMVDPYTNSTSGTVRIVALQDMDIAVRHPESFCRGANTL